MSAREIRSVHREMTPEERERWQRDVQLEEESMPENIARLERRYAATAEQTLSGELRRAVDAGGFPFADLARRADIPLEVLDDFMAGDGPLDSEAFGRLAAVLGYHLTPVGSAEA